MRVASAPRIAPHQPGGKKARSADEGHAETGGGRGRGGGDGNGDVVMVVVSTVWLLPSIMAIWFANGSKRPAEPFLPTISLRFAAGEHSARLPRTRPTTLKCLESTFAYARAN